jgi:protein O-GlcNAc transferase
LRIGYLSSDFRAHATMHLIGAMLSRHDRTRVRCHVYSYGIDDGSQHRRSVENAADSFVDLRNESDRAAAEKIHADEIDILIDLKGHTAGARLAIAALRPAPVQVTWLGYPGPVGASFFDYALVDHTVVPPEHRDRYVEGLCYLPNCYQINDDTQAALSGATDRAAQGLPERGFVFASFNRIYKLTGEVLDLWASILAAVPGSLLWLYRSRAEAVESVLAEMRARDVDPARIFFAPPMDKARHLQRIPVADLALDTFPVNGHTTTSDCLKVGLPVVAMLGEHFASRVSASLLRTMGLERLVADDKAGYRKIAIALANEPAMLASIRETALRNRATTPLFDTTRFVGNLETAYETMWRHRCAGPLPRVLEIGERDADSEAPALQMNRAEALAREAVALRQAGRLDDAIARYRESLALRPDHPPTLFRLGNALDASGGVAAAEAAYRHALSVDPGYAPASVNLAAMLDRAGRLDDAIEELLAAERLAPSQPEVPSNLAIYLARKGRHREAETALRRLVSIRSADAAAHAALAGNLQAQGRNEEAIPIFFSALALKPDEPVALGNLALSLLAVGRFDEAEAACGRAIALDSGSTDAVSNLGFVYRERGDVERAIAIWRDLLQREPDHAGTRSSLALALLAKGEFEEGWRDYEWRFRTDTLAAALRGYPQPVWDGRRIAGRTLLLDAEQGIGDAIQFLRYAGPLAEMGARVVAEAPRKLHRLLRGLPGVSALIDPADPRPEFDLHAPLMSLPHLCATTLDTIPAAVPYLAAEPGLVARWRERLAALPRPWIGLCWQGNPHHRGDRWRSLPLATLAPLTSRTGGSFVSLQKGPGSEQVAGSPFGARLLDWSADIDGGPDALVDSAAIMANLDLIVTVDTAIAHLAGALGRPVWLMLGHVPDFRWMLDRADSPWYPTMRLWRQSRRGNWSDVVADMGPAMSDTPERDHVG